MPAGYYASINYLYHLLKSFFVKNKQLLIAGMHRCGTSYTANIVQTLGIPIGDELIGATPSNTKGHFEDKEILELHERMLHYNHTSMYEFECKPLSITQEQKEQALAIVQQRDASLVQWGFKQPRATLFLPFWNSLLSAPHYIFLVRPPAEVVNSLLKRESTKKLERQGAEAHQAYLNNIDEHTQAYAAMYVCHVRRMLEFIADYPDAKHLILDFNQPHAQNFEVELKNRLLDWGYILKEAPVALFDAEIRIKPQEFLLKNTEALQAAEEAYTALLDQR